MDNNMKMESEVVKEKIHTEPMLNDPRYITLLSAIVLILTLLFWWFFSRRHQARRSVLLTGLSESGKTLLFVQLAYSQYRQTFTSIRENVEDYFVGSKSLKIVDIPGQERLRNKFFEKYRNSAKAIVYVVDSATIQKEIRDVAEYLFTIISDPVVQSNNPPVLILCNKQDQPLAKGGQAIKTLLEKEINLVRTTKSAQLESVGGSQQSTVSVGRAGKDFEFSQLKSRVDVAECAALTEQTEDAASDADGIVPLKDWIARL